MNLKQIILDAIKAIFDKLTKSGKLSEGIATKATKTTPSSKASSIVRETQNMELFTKEWAVLLGQTADALTEIVVKEATRGAKGVKMPDLQLAVHGVVLGQLMQFDSEELQDIANALNVK